jgi:DNA-binding protein HU-beta
MNKTELINAVAKSSDMSRKDADKAVNAVIAAIADALKAGEKVQLSGLGGFEVKERAARMGRNPRTGEPQQIAASKSVSFKPGKALKDEING